jgi:RNA polymerase sigma factor (sigma-70 family)
MEKFSEDILIQGIRNREDGAFKYLQIKFQDSIRLMVIEMGGTAEDAKDVFNEGLIALIRLVDEKDFRLTCKLGTLFYALCNKKWKQHLEKQTAARNYHVRKLEPSHSTDFSENYDDKLYHEIFWECFNKLDKVCKEILKGYFMEQSPRDIAEFLGYSYGYVRKKKSLCYSYLIKMIQNNPVYIKIKETERTTPVGHE